LTSSVTRDRPLIFLLGAVAAMGGFATNIFLPALPEIRTYFGVPIAAAQTTISAYIIAFAAGILVAGPMSDRFGRRPLILAGMGIFAVWSVVAATALSLPWLVAGRIIQAIGAAAGVTVARATIGDISDSHEVASRMALMTMAIVVSNAAAPYIGGIIAHTLGWHADFWLLLVLGVLIAAACWRLLPETRQATQEEFSIRQLHRASGELLRQPVFRSYLLQASAIYSLFLVFMAITPYVMADALHAPPQDFGLYSFALAIGYFLGNMQVSKHARKPGADRLLSIGLWLQFGAAAVALLLQLVGIEHPLAIFGPMLPLTFAQGLALPYLTARAVTIAPGYAGVASSLLGFAQQVFAAVTVQSMGWAPTDSAIPVFIFCTAVAALALLPALMRERPVWSS
jgi:DHA1 family bicyclomycin/chloramphenicol resistance-like MFS transporter